MRGVAIGLWITFGFVGCQSIEGRDYAAGVKRAAIDVSYVDDSLEDEFGNEITATTLRAGGSLGYFVTGNFELGGDLAITDQEQDVLGITSEANTVAFGGFATYHMLNSGAVRPFLSAGFGLLSGSSGAFDIDGIYYGLQLGVSTFVSESTSIDFAISKLWSDQDWDVPGVPTFSVDEDVLALTVGVSFLF